MSFKLGNFNTAYIRGFSAILQSIPSLPVDTAVTAYTGGDGGVYTGSRMTSTRWEFTLRLEGSSVVEVLKKADEVSGAVNPQVHGLQDFRPLALDPWTWQGVVSGGVAWERDDILWLNGICVLHGSMEIITPDPYGKAVLSPVVRNGPGSLELKDIGNAPYYPEISITGESTNSRSIKIVSEGHTAEIFTVLSSGEILVLNFETLEFYVWSTSFNRRLRNVAHLFTTFHRFRFSGPAELSVEAGLATIDTVSVVVSSRRI